MPFKEQEVSKSFNTEVFRLSPDLKTVEVFSCILTSRKAYDACKMLVDYLDKKDENDWQ